MAKSTCSLASPISSSLSSSSAASSPASTTSAGSRQNSRQSKTSTASDKALSLKSSSSIDRRKRLAANARERKRMHLLNKAYDELRLRLTDAENKSKYDVLVQAKEYIQALATICEKFDHENPNIHQEEQHPFKQHHRSSTSPSSSTYNSHLDQHKIQTAPMDMTTYNSLEHIHLKTNLPSVSITPQLSQQYTTFSYHQSITTSQQKRITFT